MCALAYQCVSPIITGDIQELRSSVVIWRIDLCSKLGSCLSVQTLVTTWPSHNVCYLNNIPLGFFLISFNLKIRIHVNEFCSSQLHFLEVELLSRWMVIVLIAIKIQCLETRMDCWSGLIKAISWLPHFGGSLIWNAPLCSRKPSKLKAHPLKLASFAFFSPKSERLALGKLMCHPLVELNVSIYSS